MRVRTAIGCGLAMLIATGSSAFAQDARATEIVAKTRKALGGSKLETLKTFSLEAAVQRNVGQLQMNADLEMALELPDKYLKSEIPRGAMSVTMNSGFNGDRAVIPAGASMSGRGMMIRMGPGGAIADAPKLTDEERAQVNATMLRNARVDISRLMLGWFGAAHPSLGAQYTYGGEAESPDGKAYVIDVKDANGFEARLFIDQNNHLPLMVTYKGRRPMMVGAGGGVVRQGESAAPRANAGTQTRQLTDEERRKVQADAEELLKRGVADQPLVQYSMFFEDWREVDGITFPHVMRRAIDGETTEEWTVSKVKVNPKIDAKKFAIEGK